MSYEKQNFVDGQILTADNLNHIENGIEQLDLNKQNKMMYYNPKKGIEIKITKDDFYLPRFYDNSALITMVNQNFDIVYNGNYTVTAELNDGNTLEFNGKGMAMEIPDYDNMEETIIVNILQAEMVENDYMIQILNGCETTIEKGSRAKEGVSTIIVSHPNVSEIKSITVVSNDELFTVDSSFLSTYGFVSDVDRQYWNNKSDKLVYSDEASYTFNINELEIIEKGDNISYYNVKGLIRVIPNKSINVSIAKKDGSIESLPMGMAIKDTMPSGDFANVVMAASEDSSKFFQIMTNACFNKDIDNVIYDPSNNLIIINHPDIDSVESFTITTSGEFNIDDEKIFDDRYQLVNKFEKDYWDNKADKSELFSGDYNDLTNKPEILNSNITYINANDYTKKVINNEIDVNMSYINEYGDVNKFIYDSIKGEYLNKALIKSNDIYSVVDVTVEEYSIDPSVQEIYFNLDSSNVCKKIIAQDNCILNKIEVHNSVNVQRIHLLNQVNEDMMLNLADKLIDRNGMAWGSIIIKDQELRRKIEDKFIKKDWYFGSPKIYDAVEKAKIQQYMFDSGIVDIWESAEYGEDARLGIIDTGLRLDLAELDTTNFLGAIDLVCNNGKTRLESIDVGTSTNQYVLHGSCVYSLIAGKGVKYYGVAPKCSWYFIKVGREDGSTTYDAMFQVPIVAMQNKLEFCTMSFSSPIINSKDHSIYKRDKLYYDLLNEYIEDFNGVFNASVKNNYNILQAYKMYSSWKPANMTHAAYLSNGVYRRRDASKAYNAAFTSYERIQANRYANSYTTFSGSSCATPIMTGIFILASNIFKKKHGRRPNKYELIDLLKNRTDPCRDSSGVLSEDPTLVGYGLINVMAYRDVSHITIQCIEREDE